MRKKGEKTKQARSKNTSPRALSLRTEREIALDFATKVHEKFDRIIKASVLFGSQAKNTATAKSDIDIILIIDDASINWDPELITWYREELGKLINAQNYGQELHINTVKLTTWWNDLLIGEPVIINMLRYGEPLIDSGGFFTPIKALLLQGKIRSTHESVYMSLQRAPTHLLRSKMAEMGALEGAYWCMVDAAQAALMTAGKIPPSPEHIPLLLQETFVDEKVLKSEFVRSFSDLHLLHKEIAHGARNHIKGSDIEHWQEASENFLNEMTRIIKQLLDKKK